MRFNNSEKSPQRLSIAMISDDFLPAATGVGVHIQRISDELVRRGHRVCVVTCRRSGQPPYEEWNGVRVYRTFAIPIYGFYQALGSTRSIRQILTVNQVDVIHYHYLGVLLIRTLRLTQDWRVAQVYTYHMPIDVLTNPAPLRPFKPWLFRMHVNYCNRFDRILVPSQGLVDQVRGYGITTPIYFCSNPVAFSGSEGADDIDTSNSFIVLYVGRLGPEKNLPLLLRAFSQMSKKVTDAELWLVGDGDQKGMLEQLAGTLGIVDKTRFIGFVAHAEIAKYFAAAATFVLPSVLETQGLVAMEAMRFSKPIIVTDRIISARELVDDGINGYIVDADDENQLAERLMRLHGDPLLRASMGREGRQRSEAYSPSAIIAEIEEHYRAAR